MTKWNTRRFALVGAVVLCAVDVAAYKQHINVTREATEATGSNAVVVQVEAPSRGKAEKFTARHYAPDRNNINFKQVDIRLTGQADVSSHSNTVAQLFFGTKRSIAKGIRTAHVFSTTEWLSKLGRWDLDPETASEVFPGPVVNHSWVTNSRLAGDLLSRADYSAISNNVLHVTGVLRSAPGAALMAGGYNSLVVGGAVKNIETPYPVINALYGEGRTRPHLVGPYPHASAAAPIAAATAIRLNALAQKKDIHFNTSQRHASHEQLPVELIKALLMASASGDFTYTVKQESHVNAFGTIGVTDNGLDKRYGMGMLNVGDAEAVLLSPYVSKLSNASVSDGRGFAYVTLATEDVLRIPVTPKYTGTLTITLAWLADLQREGAGLKGRVDDFDLSLVSVDQDSVSQKTPRIIASSSSSYDTTENIRVDVERGRALELVVTRKQAGEQPSWPVALAWNLTR